DGPGNETAWMAVADDSQAALVGYYQVLNRPNPAPRRLRLRGLDPNARYRVSMWPGDDGPTLERGADELMQVGLPVGAYRFAAVQQGDFWCRLFVLDAIS
ncbi:MAG TPA: GH36 C-terminal domain-containing protein, partial [Candidatus Dormibacteraeota bacterium]|nr:GH36 C-terminal domain-containing protein [Candidatus Dormibacteraeota bacterium]